MWVDNEKYLPDESGQYLTCLHIYYSDDKYYTIYHVTEYNADLKEWNTISNDDVVVAWMEFEEYEKEGK